MIHSAVSNVGRIYRDGIASSGGLRDLPKKSSKSSTRCNRCHRLEGISLIYDDRTSSWSVYQQGVSRLVYKIGIVLLELGYKKEQQPPPPGGRLRKSILS